MLAWCFVSRDRDCSRYGGDGDCAVGGVGGCFCIFVSVCVVRFEWSSFSFVLFFLWLGEKNEIHVCYSFGFTVNV